VPLIVSHLRHRISTSATALDGLQLSLRHFGLCVIFNCTKQAQFSTGSTRYSVHSLKRYSAVQLRQVLLSKYLWEYGLTSDPLQVSCGLSRLCTYLILSCEGCSACCKHVKRAIRASACCPEATSFEKATSLAIVAHSVLFDIQLVRVETGEN
jgi:hypothetical protein